MSTAEIVRYIDESSQEERVFLQDYLRYLNRPQTNDAGEVDEATAAMLRRRSEDLESGRHVVTQDQWEERMAALDRREH